MSNHRKAYLEILNRCNLSCAFCPGTSRKPGMLDAADFEFLAGRLKGWAEYLFYHLMGEPTSHPLLPEFIGIASKMGFKSIVTTNGTLLSSRGKVLIAAHPHKVSISLHAFEANEKIPGADGNSDGMTFEEYMTSCIDFAENASEEGIITVLRLWNLDGRSDGALNEKNEAVLDELHRRFDGEWRKIRSGMALGGKVYLEWGEKFDWPGTGAYADVQPSGNSDIHSNGNSAVKDGGNSAGKIAADSGKLTIGNTAEKLVGDSVTLTTGNTAEKLVGDSVTLTIGNAAEKLVGDSVTLTTGNTAEKLVGDSVTLTTANSGGQPLESSCEHVTGFCYALRDQVGVLCDGTVVPCCLDRNGELSLGNLRDASLEEILASPRAKAIYDGFTAHRCVEELCRRCMRSQYYR